MQGEIPNERERLNAEIERAYVNVNFAVANILTWKRFERGGSLLDIYENFYRCFCDLVIMTKDFPQMKDKGEEIRKAEAWINNSGRLPQNDKQILKVCDEGITTFDSYKKALIAELIISLPRG